MANEFNWHRKHVFAAVEVIPGTPVADAALFVAGNILTMVTNLGFDLKPQMIKRAPDRGGLGSLVSMVGQRPASWKWSHPAFTSGSAGTAPSYAPFLRACCLKETVSAGVSVTYGLDANSTTTLTVGWEVISEDGTICKRYVASGVRGNAILKASEIGSYWEWEYSLEGAFVTASDVPAGSATTPVSAIAYPDMVANAIQFARFQSPTGIFARQMADCSIDFGVRTEMRTDTVNESGLSYGMPGPFETMLKTKFRSLPRATFDPSASMVAGTLLPSGCTFGTTAGKILQLTTGANSQIEGVANTNIGNAAAEEVTLMLHSSPTTVADDGISVVFK